ncbi:MAG: rod shape-determining protein MreD [Chloroflexota bacterium]|nr:rod shape-determining protein MreD [Chloroflexota bacterium]
MERREAGAGGEIARVLVAALLLIFALAQGPVIESLFPLDVTPNLVLVLLTLWVGYHGLREGMAWAFAAGFLLDLLLFAPLGAHALAFMAVALAIEPVRHIAFGENHAWALVAVFVAALLSDFVFILVTNAAGHPLRFDTLWRFSIARALTDVLAAVILMPFVLWMRRWGKHADFASH